jgi:hypothetical protein|tara:strand:+ start:74 stop:262 length:189 start_codon:yes stop_codon:yes gene_type:complete
MVSEKTVIVLMLIAIVLSGVSLVMNLGSSSESVPSENELLESPGSGNAIALFVEERGEEDGA